MKDWPQNKVIAAGTAMHKIGNYLLLCPEARKPAFLRTPVKQPLFDFGFPQYSSIGNLVRCFGIALYDQGSLPFQKYRPEQFDATMHEEIGIGAGRTMVFAAAVLLASTISFDYRKVRPKQLTGTRRASEEETPTQEEQELIRGLVMTNPEWFKAAADWHQSNKDWFASQRLLPKEAGRLQFG